MIGMKFSLPSFRKRSNKRYIEADGFLSFFVSSALSGCQSRINHMSKTTQFRMHASRVVKPAENDFSKFFEFFAQIVLADQFCRAYDFLSRL